MNYLTHALREHQELAVFLTLAIGFLIGRLRIGTFSLGTAVGTLLAGVAIGQLNIQVAAVVKYVFFDFFIFTTGYKVGPQFFRALKKDALPQLALTLVLRLTCLPAAYTAAKLLGYDLGTAAGRVDGAFTAPAGARRPPARIASVLARTRRVVSVPPHARWPASADPKVILSIACPP